MPCVIFKCPYIKGGTKNGTAHLGYYVRYMATRDGAQRIAANTKQLPATKKQREMVEQLLRDFPLSRGMFEYEDFLARPTRGNASEFITRVLEDNYDQVAKRENYVDYIASRPRAQHTGSHALFTDTDDPLVLSQIADMVAHHPGNVWLPIISLRREDASRLGYESAEQWHTFLSSYAAEIAKAMKIPWDQFRWYAAFHDESHHPHVHMVCYSADGRSGFLTKEGIAQIKSGLVKEIFQEELHQIYERQTQRRDELIQETADTLRLLMEQMQTGTLENPRIEQCMTELALRLKSTSGKKQYGYLKAPLKSIVDEIVNELAKDPRIAQAYDLWYQLREDVLRGYRDNLPERLPLSQQKEFKRIKNLVIEEAVQLGEYTSVFSPTDVENRQEQLADSMVTDAEPPMEDGAPAVDDLPPDGEPSPSVAWSDRYRQARLLLFGCDECHQDFGQAFSLFLEEAHAGNALAMHDLGRMYSDGLGREIDMERSQEWYAKALAAFHTVENERPDRYVEYRIGKMYAAGLGTEQNYASAAEWFSKSAEQNYKYAQYSLAGLYQRGQGVEQDYKKAHGLYEKSAAQGFPYAAYELGKMYRDGIGCLKNEQQSATHFSAAYDGFRLLEKRSHDDKLQYRISWMLLHGVGTEKDETAARMWFEKAAALDNPHAQYHLGKLLLQGEDVPKDTAEAIRLLTASAAQGNQYAQYFLEHMNDPRGPSLLNSATRLLHHMGKIFREQNPRPVRGIYFVDSKLRRKIIEKKIAMGHKADDHENSGIKMK